MVKSKRPVFRHSGKCEELKKSRDRIMELRDQYPADSKKWIEWQHELDAVNRTLDAFLKQIAIQRDKGR